MKHHKTVHRLLLNVRGLLDAKNLRARTAASLQAQVILAVFAVLAASGASSAQVAFQLLTERDAFPWWMRVRDLSADGRVVVGYSQATAANGAFRWTAETGMQYLSPAVVNGETVRLGSADGVSADGSVVVGPATGGRLYRWMHGAGVTLHTDGFDLDWVTARASHDGAVVVGDAGFLDNSLPYRWTPGEGLRVMPSFPVPVGRSRAHRVSGDGRVVVGGARRNPMEFPWVWTETDGYTVLPIPDIGSGSGGRAFAASFDGSIVVGEARVASGTVAAMWRAPYASYELLGDLSGGLLDGTAYDCSDDGSVVVGYSSAANGVQATIWRTGEAPRAIAEMLLTDFGVDIGQRTLSHAIAVSGDGKVVAGDSYPLDGLYDPWVARIDPTVACPCDFDPSSPAVDHRDVVAFVNAWFAGQAAADFNDDGLFDIHDLLEFLDCWFPVAATAPCSPGIPS